jgi:hypothetical protein
MKKLTYWFKFTCFYLMFFIVAPIMTPFIFVWAIISYSVYESKMGKK